jgi:hypothetical protein
MKNSKLHICLLLSIAFFQTAYSQDDDERNGNNAQSGQSQAELFISGGPSYIGQRDQVISNLLFNGNGGYGEIGYASVSDIISTGIKIYYQEANTTTELSKSYVFDEGTSYTVNGFNYNEIPTENIGALSYLNFRLTKPSKSQFSLWLGANLSYNYIHKDFIIPNFQNISIENYTAIGPSIQAIYNPHPRHQLNYILNTSLFGNAKRSMQSNLKPMYSDKDYFIDTYSGSGIYGIKSMFSVYSTLRYQYLLHRHWGLNITYQLYYQKYALPRESKLVSQQVYLGVSFIF